ncbi:hypothetical protein D3C85_1100410 [compost metagenome]
MIDNAVGIVASAGMYDDLHIMLRICLGKTRRFVNAIIGEVNTNGDHFLTYKLAHVSVIHSTLGFAGFGIKFAVRHP